jgi:hypothetical protein
MGFQRPEAARPATARRFGHCVNFPFCIGAKANKLNLQADLLRVVQLVSASGTTVTAHRLTNQLCISTPEQEKPFRPFRISATRAFRKERTCRAPRSWVAPVAGPNWLKAQGGGALQLAEVCDARGTSRFQFSGSCQNAHSANIDVLQRQSDACCEASGYFSPMSQGQTPTLLKCRRGGSARLRSLCGQQ